MTISKTKRQSAGFTVIELMVVMMILGLLVAMSLSAYSAAINHARTSRTKVIIAKLDQLVMERWESYRTRPIPLRATAGQNVRLASERRLWALREIMRMELPNTRADVNDTPTLVTRTAINRGYLRKVPAGWTDTWQHAECLYLIIASMRDHEKSALDFFTTDEIGDTDGDGVPEILDGWGIPIQFVRWPAGYLPTATNPALTPQDSTIPDSFDLLKVDRRYGDSNTTNDPYDLKPLIYSCGPDKQVSPTTGIILPDFGYSTTTIDGSTAMYPNPPDGKKPYANDPYYSPSSQPLIGSIDGVSPVTSAQAYAAAADNITNHYQEAE